MDETAEWLCAVCVSLFFFSFCVFASLYAGHHKTFTQDRLAIAWIAGALSLCVSLPLIIVAATTEKTSGGVLTTRTWFGAGWKNGLSILSVKIDTWWKYALIVSYQIVRSFVGSILVNVFRSFLLVVVQGGAITSSSKKDDEKNIEKKTAEQVELLKKKLIICAQVAFNVFVYVSSIIDSMLVLSSIDMTFVTLVSTITADAITTNFFIDHNNELRLLHKASLTHIRPDLNNKTQEPGLHEEQSDFTYAAVGPRMLRLRM